MRDADPADVDRHVTEIWNTVLDVGPDEAGATFDELGGTALAALRMTAQIRDRLGVAIEPVTLLHDGTLDVLLGTIRRCTEAGAGSPNHVVGLAPVDVARLTGAVVADLAEE